MRQDVSLPHHKKGYKVLRKKRYIVYVLFVISIIMLTVPLIPHHHHADGLICMKQDTTQEAQCPTPVHHHENDDPCCNDKCPTRFSSPVPSMPTDFGPQHVFITTLFTDFIIESLLRPQERRLADEHVYRESLHGTNITRVFSLRAPPCTFS